MAEVSGASGRNHILQTLETRLRQLQFETVVTAWSKLVLMDSPGILAPVVLTGRYRSNWTIGVGAPNTSTRQTAGRPGAPVAPPSQPALPGMTLGQTVYITNSLPYSGRIEAGHSRKAPAGVVGPVVRELQQEMGAIVQEIARS
jgi:hypothetical protein